MEKIQKDKLIVKSNDMIEASYRLTLQEQRIILYMAAQIQPDDEDFKLIQLNISEFAELLDLEDSNYVYMQHVTRKLLEKVITIKKERSRLQINWLSSVEYFHNNGYVELCFDPKLKPYLLQLKKRFTKYHLKNIIRLRHLYSIRFYELLKQYESIGWRYFELEELRRILGINPDEYKLYADFKRFVLKPVKSEFDKKYNKGELDFTFDYKEIKERRKVIGIRFEIKKQQQLAFVSEKQNDTSKTQIDNEKLVDELVAMNLTKRQAQNIVKKYPAERILRNIELTKQKNTKGEVNNLAAFLIDAIGNDFAKDYNPVNPKLAELHTETKKCWNKNNGSCGARWSRYKDDQSSACYHCAKFETQRNLTTSI